MSDTKHTPGPWKADEYFHVSANGRDVADIRIFACNGYALDTIERTANARLIAAAPDMLAALKDELESLTRWQSAREILPLGMRDGMAQRRQTIQALIAKATEGQ